MPPPAPPTLTLHYSPGTASMVVHWLLIELDLAHQLVEVDIANEAQKSPEYLALNPNGVVPTLIVDGRAHFEAAALAMRLAELAPQAGLAPAADAAERIDYLQWMFHLANAVQPLLRQWWYADEPAGAAHADAVRTHAAARLEAAWARLDAHLGARGPYLLGAAISVADFHLTMLMRWSRKMARPADAWPALAALAARMKARPSFAALYAREGLSEWA